MKEIPFIKMHGIGNDYIYMLGCPCEPELLPELAVAMSDRHCGVGGDGIVLILPSEVADIKMRIFNADGSEAKMCGNATRCIGKLVYERGMIDKPRFSLETLSGIKFLDLVVSDSGCVDSVTVDMGEPVLTAAGVPVIFDGARMINHPVMTSRGELKVTAVSMGNPHGVIFVDSVADTDVHGIGRELEMHQMWPDRANIEFVEPVSASEVRMRVWERGSGETRACGTGACATVVAAVLNGVTGREVTVRLLGGDLKIRWDESDNRVYMTGPAEYVFDGVYRFNPDK